MITPIIKRPVVNRRVGASRRPEANRSVQRNVRKSSAVSNTAGMTVEKETVDNRKCSRPLKASPPRYSQLPVLLLIHSKSHQAGAEVKNNQTKSPRDRSRMDVPLRKRTSASTP